MSTKLGVLNERDIATIDVVARTCVSLHTAFDRLLLFRKYYAYTNLDGLTTPPKKINTVDRKAGSDFYDFGRGVYLKNHSNCIVTPTELALSRQCHEALRKLLPDPTTWSD